MTNDPFLLIGRMKRNGGLLSVFWLALMLGVCQATPQWGTGRWDKDDAELTAIEKAVVSRTQNLSKKDFSAILREYQTLSEDQPSNVQAQYQYAFALRGYTSKFMMFYTPPMFLGISERLVAHPVPRSYKYTRMTFLVRAMTGLHMHELFEVGQRLVKRNPNDYDVLYRLPDTANYKIAAQRTLAFQTAYKARSLRPDSPGTLHLLANTYGGAWVATRNVDYGRKSAHYYIQLSKDTRLPRAKRDECKSLADYVTKEMNRKSKGSIR